jgi:uncharacterized phage infection (PIP) family protein YhgE
MLAPGIVMLFMLAATALGQPAQSTDQAKPEQPPQAQPESPQPVPEQGQEEQFRERFERQRQELMQRREQLEQTVQDVEEQVRQSQQALSEQSRQLEQRLDELHSQIRQTDYELAELHRQELAERTRDLVGQLRDHQEQSRRIERELRELERAGGGQMRGPERMDRTQDGREEAPRPSRAPESDVRRGEERGEVLRQIEVLGQRMNQLEQDLKASSERDRPRVESPGDESRRECTPPKQARRTLASVECDTCVRQNGLATDVGELRTRMDTLQQNLTQTNALLNSMLSQAGRSTVGSAGYCWGW